MPRELPIEISDERVSWWYSAVVYRVLHYTLGTIATVAGALVAFNASATFMPQTYVSICGIVTAVFSGLLMFAKPDKEARKYLRGYRRLNLACIRYSSDETFELKNLLAAHEEAQYKIEAEDTTN